MTDPNILRPTAATGRIPPALAIAAVAIVMAAIILFRLGAVDVCSDTETVEAVFVQQMVERGNVLFPLENGSVPMYKPPLFHWTALAIDRLAGIRKVTAANLRLPSALYATAGAILTMVFAYGILGIEGAVLAGLILAGSYQYMSQARYGRVDMTLCFFETLALLSFVWWMPRRRDTTVAEARREARGGALYVVALAMGLGVLAKGPVGALLPGIAIVVFMIVERRPRQLLAMLEPGALFLGAALASSWYLACYIGGRYAFLDRQLGAENFGRFFGSLGGMPLAYYVVPIFLNSTPLSLLVPVAVAAAIVKRPHREESEFGRHAEHMGEATRLALRLFAIFWVVTIVFFSAAAYKRQTYLLPLWPVSAVMLAWWVCEALPPRWGRVAAVILGVACCTAVIVNLVYIPMRERGRCAGGSYRAGAEDITRVVGPDEPLYAYGWHEEIARLLFYLDRDAPELNGKLDRSPPGYILLLEDIWEAHKNRAAHLEFVLSSEHGERKFVLLRRVRPRQVRSYGPQHVECRIPQAASAVCASRIGTGSW
jgi:4-amino-4-deoxy-L-arabinose transferase-like glycosyltransferase